MFSNRSARKQPPPSERGVAPRRRGEYCAPPASLTPTSRPFLLAGTHPLHAPSDPFGNSTPERTQP